jgi:hypothetical protein
VAVKLFNVFFIVNCIQINILSSFVSETRSLISLEKSKTLKDLGWKVCQENATMLPRGQICRNRSPVMRKCPICRQFVKGAIRIYVVLRQKMKKDDENLTQESIDWQCPWSRCRFWEHFQYSMWKIYLKSWKNIF